MKQSPRERELHKRLEPSKFSSKGFLGEDQRALEEIIAEDHRMLEQLNITKEQLVNVLKEAYKKAKAGLGTQVNLAPGVTAFHHESRGRIPSPFQGDGVFEKGEAIVTFNDPSDKIVVTALSIHLIEKHDFFQGRGSYYRIEPSSALKLLDI
jgi:hypothetical protein